MGRLGRVALSAAGALGAGGALLRRRGAREPAARVARGPDPAPPPAPAAFAEDPAAAIEAARARLTAEADARRAAGGGR